MAVDVLGPLRVRTPPPETDRTPDRRAAAPAARPARAAARRVVSAPTAPSTRCGRPARRVTPAAALQTHVFRLRRALPDGLVDVDGHRVPARSRRRRPRRRPAGRRRADAAADAPPTRRRRRRPRRAPRRAGAARPTRSWPTSTRAAVEAARLEELRVRRRRGARRGPAGARPAPTEPLADLADPRRRAPAARAAARAADGRRSPPPAGTVDALRAYDDFRRRLGDELGIEPSPSLAARHAALLAGGRHRRPAVAGPRAPAAGRRHLARRSRPAHRRWPSRWPTATGW